MEKNNSNFGTYRGKKMEWQLLVLAILIFVLFIVSSSIGLWLAYKNTNFNSDATERSIKSVMITMVMGSIFFPMVYLLYNFFKVSNSAGQSVSPSRTALFVIAVVVSLLIIFCSSLSVWITNLITWNSNNQFQTVKITMIVFIVVGVFLSRS
jgi:hypothetical protein